MRVVSISHCSLISTEDSSFPRVCRSIGFKREIGVLEIDGDIVGCRATASLVQIES